LSKQRSRGKAASKRALFVPGARVRLRAPSPGLKLTSDLGTIVGPGDYDGYFVVRLDAPALLKHHGDTPEILEEVIQLYDNMDVVPDASAEPATNSEATLGATAPERRFVRPERAPPVRS
jgi:hypothetical protein